MSDQQSKRGRGRPRIYSGKGAPSISVRLEPGLMEWVQASGRVRYIRRLIEADMLRSLFGGQP